MGALIPSQSTRAQPSAGEVAKLAALVRRERVKAIFPESSINPALAEALARETGAKADAALYGDTLGPAGSDADTYLTMESGQRRRDGPRLHRRPRALLARGGAVGRVHRGSRRTAKSDAAHGGGFLCRIEGRSRPGAAEHSPTACRIQAQPCGFAGSATIFGGVLTITDVLAVPAAGGFFADDQAAIKAGAVRDGLAYPPGVRAPAEAVSLLLVLSDGHVAHGDCVSVQYSGVGGREPRLRAAELSARLERELAAAARRASVPSFRDTDALIDGTAARYGLSQALLDAAAHAAGTTMAEVVRDEWGLSHAFRPIPIYAQTGEERRANVDKMILKQVDSLPHGLINTPALAAGIVDYVRWVRDRVLHLRAERGLRADPALRRLRAAGRRRGAA